MVTKKRGKTFLCEECGLEYADIKTAEECEAWCREHKSCNTEIIKKAIPSQ